MRQDNALFHDGYMMNPDNSFAAQNGDTPEIRFVLLSHDVRSMLGGIVGGLSLIDAAGLSDEDRSRLNSAKSAAKMLTDLMGDLAGNERNRDTVPVDFNSLLAELETRWLVEAREKGVSIRFTHKPDMAAVSCLNRTDLMRIYNNLISNAVNNAGQGLIVVETAETGNKTVQITIRDEGPGFSDASLKNLFAFRNRPAGSTGKGSGLGLFIVKTLVDKAGGTVTAKNRPDGGAVVQVVLAISPLKARAEPAPGLPDLSHLRILVAEDNVTNQMVVTQMLAAMHAQVTVASDGVEAMKLFEQEAFDLCLIDIEMPRKSGLEVMREIRALPDSRAATPLVALTAYAMDEHRQRISNAGADGLIAKPLTDIAGFGRSILSYLGHEATQGGKVADTGRAEVIEREVYDGLAKVIGPASMKELLGKVQEDLERVAEGIKTGLADDTTAPIRANTHILISVAGAIGAVSLQNIAQEMNIAANDSDWPAIVALAPRCLAGLDAVQGFIASELEFW